MNAERYLYDEVIPWRYVLFIGRVNVTYNHGTSEGEIKCLYICISYREECYIYIYIGDIYILYIYISITCRVTYDHGKLYGGTGPYIYIGTL